METIEHPVSGVAITGIRLQPGDVIQFGDKYDSTTGKWESGNSSAGLRIEKGCTTIWVREVKVRTV